MKSQPHCNSAHLCACQSLLPLPIVAAITFSGGHMMVWKPVIFENHCLQPSKQLVHVVRLSCQRAHRLQTCILSLALHKHNKGHEIFIYENFTPTVDKNAIHQLCLSLPPSPNCGGSALLCCDFLFHQVEWCLDDIAKAVGECEPLDRPTSLD